MQLLDFDSTRFLRDTWQQHPLLIRNPWAAWRNPLEPDELAGLACEDGVESRLITHSRKALRSEHGPFAEKRFGKLGKAPWSLLVQAADHHAPQVAELIAPFRFIPNWRIDDVMVSYASDGGGVGPHFDQYDVFLVQGLGRRRWQLGARCDEDTPLLPHDDLRLLARFEPTAEWLLEPGDILYIPPGVAHNGIAEGDGCMTYSIGFRAPSRAELIAGWCDDLVAGLEDGDRYADPGLPAQDNPGEISPAALAALQAMVTEKLADRAAFARWFGAFATTRKYPDLDWHPDEPMEQAQVRALLEGGADLIRNPASRFSFIRGEAGAVSLFVDGECHECHGEAGLLAERLCASERLAGAADRQSPDAVAELIAGLFNRGSIAFEDGGSSD
ncbi:MAG: cupin domain-containing protein [Novosphingobium sp.]